MARPKKIPSILPFLGRKGPIYNVEAEKELNFIGQRLIEARNRKGYSQEALRQALRQHGVSVSSAAIGKWERGESIPSAHHLLAAWQALVPEEDITFFMSGYARPQLNELGRKKVAEYQEDLIASGRYKPVAKTAEIQYIDMPVSLLSISAGTGEFLAEENFEQVSVPANTVPEGADFGVRVSGDSMEPVYHDGQIVWVQHCKEVPVGEVGIFVYDGEGYIKVYDEQEPDEALRDMFIDSYGELHKQPVLISYNQNYPPRAISPNAMFQIVGKVLK